MKVSVNNNYSITQTSWYKGVTEIHKGSELLVNADLNNHNGILKISRNTNITTISSSNYNSGNITNLKKENLEAFLIIKNFYL